MPSVSVTPMAPLIFAGLALASASALIGSFELTAFFTGADTETGRVLQIQPGQTSLGWSQESMRLALRDCVISLRNPQQDEMRNAGEEGRRQVAATCLAQAEAAVARFPISSYAYFARALANLSNGNTAAFNEDLVRSQAVGASEQWVSELRIALAEDNFSLLSEPAIAAEAADIRILLISNQGLRSLSMRYVANASFRERIADIAETMPADVQARFVRTLQRSLPR